VDKTLRNWPDFEASFVDVDTSGRANRLPGLMVSATQQSERIRKRKHRKAGVRRKRAERAHGTPAFAIHPVGYDAKAPDAKKAPESK
jgi:DNA invertase Pin-like site-specific DNA recombinase